LLSKIKTDITRDALDEKIWLREEDRLGDFTLSKKLSKKTPKPRWAELTMDVS
jgi:hypothetical protein